MPEIKHNFTGGRMNKDIDERLVPNGEYRDAMNIQVSTSEGSEVGTVQNILGNTMIPGDFVVPADAIVVGSIADEKIDTFYWFMYTPSVDYVLSYKRDDPSTSIIFRDVNKNVLKFDPANMITGVNVIDDMLFWTDNHTEPKKINITRCKSGTSGVPTEQTKLINNSQLVTGTEPDIEEKHITVIKKTPPTPLEMKLVTSRRDSLIYTGVIRTGVDAGSGNYTSFIGSSAPFNFSGITTKPGSNFFNISIEEGVNASGDVIGIGDVGDDDGLTGWHDNADYSVSHSQARIPVGTKIVFKPFDDDATPPGLPVTAYALKGVVEDSYPNDDALNTWANGVSVRITSVDGVPPLATEENDDGNLELKYVVDLFEEEDKLFEFKFPRFSYRYKYEDGEYSPFAPFTQVAFSPGSFDYHPRKGYNLGMTNRLKEVQLKKFINDSTPEDVVSVDILFKDEPSPNVYVVDTISPNDYIPSSASLNTWHTIKNGGPYIIDKETVSSVTPTNQMLRPWDNVPKKALAQEVTGNRVVYANYVQNYNLTTGGNKKYFAEFNATWGEFERSLRDVAKSIKSLREYQLGVVFTDKYGRETPVISNPTGTIKLPKHHADKNNRLEVEMLGNEFPQELTHFKFFVKETSDQYYNMAMDRWYDAEDGNIWLAFPSSDRNKLDIDTFIILKKGTDADELVKDAARYKVLAIESEAPDFIKTTKRLIAKNTHNFGGGINDTDIFGNTNIDAPLLGRDNFKMRYQPFQGTTGSNLADIKEDLYVEFGKLNENEISHRYKISSITNDWDGTETISGSSTSNFADAQYSLLLEKNLGNDVNFISDDPLGVNVTQINDTAVVNIYEYKVENKPQFDGRFFVKIYKDEVFTKNITSVAIGASINSVLGFREVYGLNSDHVNRHTQYTSRFHIDGKKCARNNNTAGNDWDNDAGIAASAITGFLSTDELKLGYYLDDLFSSFALYFRRYSKGLRIGTSGALQFPWQLNYLKKGGSSGPNGTHIYQPHAPSDDVWSVDDNSSYEFGLYLGVSSGIPIIGRTGMTANFHRFGHTVAASGGSLPIFTSGYIEHPSMSPSQSFFQSIPSYVTNEHILQSDNPKPTEVWFIDSGPYAGYVSGNDLLWGVKDTNQAISGQNVSSNSNSVLGSGVRTTAGGTQFRMEIGFGGIRQITGQADGINSGFFNVGDWHTGSGSINPEYSGSQYKDFTDNFEIGTKFRWKEDPNQIVYIIGDVESDSKLRHSYTRNLTEDDGQGGQVGGNISKLSVVSSNGNLTHLGFPLTNNMFKGKPNSKAQDLSFNFTKNWKLKECEGENGENMVDEFNPAENGIINGGFEIDIEACDRTGGAGGDACTGINLNDDLKIYVNSLNGVNNRAGTNDTKIHVGSALTHFTNGNGFEEVYNQFVAGGVFVSNITNQYLVVRHIVELQNGKGFELWLGGYAGPLSLGCEHQMAIDADMMPEVGGIYRFQQVGVNGYSPNSEFNINTMGHNAKSAVGRVGAVGYTLEFLGVIEPEEPVISTNPAIFETEPKDVKDLDIYYETTGAIPMNFDQSNIQDAFPIGTIIKKSFKVVGYDEHKLILDTTWFGLIGIDPLTSSPYEYSVVRPDGLEFMCAPIASVSTDNTLEIEPILYNTKFKLPWHNCYAFGNGVESNRIRDNFNLTYIANGVKASTTLEQEYKEEHRKYGLIYSGLYNSTSGVNNLNQFIAAEKITKDINPIYGSIQKLHSRDSDLVTLCEDKCLRILANKDAVFNADGNSQLTATENVLGQTIPFTGEYGISTNPESFASESYRVYFTDKIRGVVMRLSKDGLTPISNHGMKDWFKDNLKIANKIIGSHDDKKEEYNITLDTTVDEPTLGQTVSFKEDVRGWVSFKSFVPEHAISTANDYYTFLNGKLWRHHVETKPRNNFYDNQYDSSVTVILNDNPGYIKEFNTLNYEGSQSKIEKFTSTELQLDFQPTTTYNDQEYYNLSNKDGWRVESIVTNDEDGYIDEFIEKEGKWFNYIKREVDLSLPRADTGDFSFQGIGFAETDYVPPDPCIFNYGFGVLGVNPQNSCEVWGELAGSYQILGVGGDVKLYINNLNPIAPWHFVVETTTGDPVYQGPTRYDQFFEKILTLPANDYIASVVFDECPNKGNSIDFSVICGGPPVTPSWDCNSGVCSDPGTGNGLYTSLAACEASLMVSYNPGICDDPSALVPGMFTLPAAGYSGNILHPANPSNPYPNDDLSQLVFCIDLEGNTLPTSGNGACGCNGGLGYLDRGNMISFYWVSQSGPSPFSGIPACSSYPCTQYLVDHEGNWTALVTQLQTWDPNITLSTPWAQMTNSMNAIANSGTSVGEVSSPVSLPHCNCTTICA